MRVCAESLQSVSASLRPYGLQPARLLRACNSPARILLQGIFPGQVPNLPLTPLALAGGFFTTSSTREARRGPECTPSKPSPTPSSWIFQ